MEGKWLKVRPPEGCCHGDYECDMPGCKNVVQVEELQLMLDDQTEDHYWCCPQCARGVPTVVQ